MDEVIDISARAFAEKIFSDIGEFSRDPVAGCSRQGYGELENRAHAYLKGVGESLGLEIHTDPAGNLFMTYPGEDRTLPALFSGSHADTVPEGGNFDGLAGVVAPLSVIYWMKSNGIRPKRDFTVLVMRMEESSYFGKAYVGSLAMMGKLTPADLQLRHRTKDQTLAEAIREAGFDPEAMVTGKPLLDRNRVAAFIEVHIEQGPTLDSKKEERVGVVTGIRGNLRHKKVEVIGETAHSGAVDREFRHDSVLAMAEFFVRMEKHWSECLAGGGDLVFTSGVVNTSEDAAIAKVPGLVSFCLDMRSLSMETLDRFHEKLLAEADAVSKERGVEFVFSPLLRTASAKLDPAVVSRIAAAADKAGIPHILMPSGAGHDAAVISNAGIPAGMIFVANQHGSHNPREAMEISDFMTAVKLLSEVVLHYEEEE